MANKTEVVLNLNNSTFPDNGSPMSLIGVKKIILSNIKNDAKISVLIHRIGDSIAGILPYEGELEIPINPTWSGIFFIANNIPIDKEVRFTYQEEV